MKKHLKSVISFVIALALSLSSVSALAATTYDDVPADASYAEAVANLTAIGVVEGYGDGKFNPDNKITRAEVATMIIRALANNEAALSSKGATDFTDVPADHWAAGYINVASRGEQAFINGMGDGTFAPEANVTYSQVVKMLVAGIGYGDLAVLAGGYPTGYNSIAESIGITDGVGSISGDEEATRAVVAQLINNAIDTPLLVMKVYSPTDPEYVIQDGTDGKDYETILTSKHDIFKVEGRVTGTKRAGSSVDADEVKFTIESTKNYDGEVAKKADEDTHLENVLMNVGETDAASYLNIYSKMMVKVEGDEDPVILSIVASGKNSEAVLEAGAWDDEKYDSEEEALDAILAADENKAQIWYYADSDKNGKSSRYYLADDFTLYVNGVEVDVDEDSIKEYIFDNSVGTITLIDTPNQTSNSTDGRYDAVYASYYATGIVESVNTNGKVYFDKIANTGANTTSVEFDDDDEDLEYSIEFNGEEIAFTDLQEDDVLSIAYDVTVGFAESEFYEVYVSRDVAEGRVNEANDEDNEITLDGTTYGMVADVLASYANFDLGTSYTVYLDAFGNVVDYEKLASTVKYGIIYKAYEYDIEEEDRIVLYDTTATKKTFVANDDFSYDNGDFDDLAAEFGETIDEDDAADYAKRVVTYTTNSKGEIKEIELLFNEDTAVAEVEYAEKSSKLGTLKFDDNTVIIGIDGKDFTVVDSSALVDDEKYMVAGYDKDDGVYGLIIVTDGIGEYGSDARFAVVNKVTQGTNEDGDECDKLSVYTVGSDELQVIYADGLGIVEDLNKGDVVVITTNAAGVIESASDVEVIFSAGSSYSSVDFDTEVSMPSNWADDEDIELVYGPVIDRSSSDITIGEVVDNTTDIEAPEALDYADDVAVYVYDYNQSSSNRLSVGTVSSVAKTTVSKSIMLPEELDAKERYIIDWSNEDTPDPVYALVKVVDEEVTDVFVIIPKDED